VAQAHLTQAPSARSRAVRAVQHGVSRLEALLFRARLDSQLAGGADPDADPALAIRAHQLTRPRYRRRLAASVEHLVEDLGTDPGSYMSSAVPFRLDQVAEARGTLLSLAGALRDVDPVNPRGVAMTLRLITDPGSPLYAGAARGALQLRAHSALRCLLAESHPWCELPEVPLPIED
jgi:hypothetical protein